LLAGTGTGIAAIVIGPLADSHGYGTFPGLIVSLLAIAACAVCWVLGILRLVKAAWSPRA
jgi:hypothetical protein